MTLKYFQFTRRLGLLLAAFTGLVGVRLGIGFTPRIPVVDSQPQRRGVESGIDFGWLTDYQEALRVARTTSKPLMVVFRCFP